MVAAENKTKHLSSVNYTTKTANHYHWSIKKSYLFIPADITINGVAVMKKKL